MAIFGRAHTHESGSSKSENSPAESGTSATEPGTPAAESRTGEGPTWNLPFVTAQFHKPDMHVPRLEDLHLPRVSVPTPRLNRQEIGATLQAARAFLPPPEQAVYFGGLAVMAALEVIEWPVAAAIGVGTALVATKERWAHHEGPTESKAPESRASSESAS